jgi:RNase P subunit RPR2
MIDLGSIAGLHEHRHELHAYCQRCDRWSMLPLADLVAGGRGSSRLPVSVRCRDCGNAGRLQVRPPVPSHPRSVGWIETR